MHAQSRDLFHWEKTPGVCFLPPERGFDKDDWRDPFVLWDEESARYIMIIGGRKIDGERKLNACTPYFESEDCKNWTFRGTIWEPCCFNMHEMPDLFKIGDWWYLLITEYCDRSRTIYRMSRTLKGPWLAPKDDAFDGRAYYAARTFAQNGKRYLFGWVPSRNGEEDGGSFQWGGALVVHEVIRRIDGTLGVKIPDTVRNFFDKRDPVPPVNLKSVDAIEQGAPVRNTGDLFLFEAGLVFEQGTRWFALKLYEDDKTGEAYQFKFMVCENRLFFETCPNQPWSWYMMGLDRPIQLIPGKTYNIHLIVDDTIATLYAGDTALNVRMYRRPGTNLSFTLAGGALRIMNASIGRSRHE
jgi:beta-fructofuranosidase